MNTFSLLSLFIFHIIIFLLESFLFASVGTLLIFSFIPVPLSPPTPPPLLKQLLSRPPFLRRMVQNVYETLQRWQAVRSFPTSPYSRSTRSFHLHAGTTFRITAAIVGLEDEI